jgi:hypothetical protein
MSKNTQTVEPTPRDKAVAEYHVRKNEKKRFENREPEYHELQEQLQKMKEKAQRWKDRFHSARQDYGRNCDFEKEVQVFGLGCKVCGAWCYGDIDYVDEFRIDGERWEGNDRIPVCDECAEKCKARDFDYDDDTDCDSSVSSTNMILESLEKYKDTTCAECGCEIDWKNENFYTDGRDTWCVPCSPEELEL